MNNTQREVLFRANKGDSYRWYFGRVDGKYCWWSHTQGPKTSYRYVDTEEELLNLVEWFKSKGFSVTEAQ